MKKLDDKDLAILQMKTSQWEQQEGPRVGDFVYMLDGTMRRFTHDWGDDIQTTVGESHPCNGDASFYLYGESASFSGSLDRAIPKSSLLDTGATAKGWFWFFHHNEARAHNAVYVQINCKVYKQEAA